LKAGGRSEKRTGEGKPYNDKDLPKTLGRYKEHVPQIATGLKALSDHRMNTKDKK